MSQQPEAETPLLSKTELREYLMYHSHRLSLKDLKAVVGNLPRLREQFEEVKAPGFPHTGVRLAFLADLVECFVGGGCEDLPFESATEAAFALIYLDQEFDLIPDCIPEIGYTDDAMIVALVMERNAPAFQSYAKKNGKDWESLAVAENEL